VEWGRGEGDAAYVVAIGDQVEDRKGVLAEISAKVSAVNTNIINLRARPVTAGLARIDLTVEISDVKHLDKVMRAIKNVPGVMSVERMRPGGAEDDGPPAEAEAEVS
jgi:GTP pyrophosphokinase